MNKRMTSVILLVFCILSAVGTYAAVDASDSDVLAAKTDVPSEVYRLPQTIFPEYYKLNLLTHIDDEEGFRFLGNVSILVSFIVIYADSVFIFGDFIAF